MNSKSSHPITKPYTLLIAVAALVALRSIAHGAQIQQGDQIKLTREEPLLFHDQVFRAGKEGESFSVLAYHPEQKKVFVLAKDKDGKDIALSIAEDAITVVTKASNKLDEQALAAAKSGKLDEAKRLIAQAIKANPTDVGVQTHNTAIAALATAKSSLDRAKAEHPKTMAAAAAKRKNAAVVDRPNPLNPNDGANHDRAERMRAEADQMESSAEQALADAESRWRASLDALESGEPVAEPAHPTANRKVSVQPGKELTESERRQLAKQDAQDAAAARNVDARQAKQWASEPANADKFIEPDLLANADPPTYAETLTFINGKLAPLMSVGFGEKTGKMIVRFNYSNGPGFTATFNPKDLNAEVRYEKKTRVVGDAVVNETRNEGAVFLQVRNGEQRITLLLPDGDDRGNLKTKEVPTDAIRIGDNGMTDYSTAQKLAKAFSHLIQMFGGKKEAF